MDDVTVKDPADLELEIGPRIIPGYRRLLAAKTLGVSAWGMSIIELAKGNDRHPTHDHVGDGQEEVYAVLKGSAILKVNSDAWVLVPGTLARVGPARVRKLVAGPDGALVLAIGATPGQVYQPPWLTPTGLVPP